MTGLVNYYAYPKQRVLMDLIRECADLISVSLCDLFNKSLLSGIFSDDWKCAKVTPLFKKGEASDLNNYGPISVISVRTKVFERTVDDQLYNFLSNEDIISTINRSFTLYTQL